MLGAKPNFDFIFNGNSTSLIIMRNEIGQANLNKILVLLLEDLVNYFNVQRPMNNDQILDLSLDIMRDMRDLTFEEIVAFIEGIKKEEYGKIYERFDASMFWKFYWGENPDDRNSYNYKKMNFCLADAKKTEFSDPKIVSDLHQKIIDSQKNARGSGSLIREHLKNLPTKPPK